MPKQKLTREWFAAALRGAADREPGQFAGLRSYATGFDPRDGYDLTKFATWSRYRKDKVRRAFEDVAKLRSQPHHVFRGRNADHMRIAREANHGDIKVSGLKVAFVKYTPPSDRPHEPPKLRFRKNSMIVDNGYSEKQFIAFEPGSLFADIESEMARIIAEAGPDRKHFTIQADVYEIPAPYHSPKMLAKEVVRLQSKYDGVSIPANRQSEYRKGKWNPKHHDAKKWLTGVNAYGFKNQKTPSELGEDSRTAREYARAQRARLKAELGKLKG